MKASTREKSAKKLRPVVYAAIYARYSSDMQSPTSAKDQIDRAKYLAGRNEISTRLYKDAAIKIDPQWVQSDEAVTGRIAARHGYQTILDGIRRQAFHILIVDDLSRLTRSLGNLLDLYELLKHYDVELVSIADRMSSADPNARTFFTFKGMVADFGNEAHAGRTIRGLQARAREEFSTGQKPYGYGSEATRREMRKGREVLSHFRILINPEQAVIIKRIFELYSDGHGKIAIAKILNNEGVPPSSSRAKGWQPGPIDRILHNEKYIGRWIYGRHYESRDPETGKKRRKERPRSNWIVKNREELRIVPQELWDKVQKRRQENKVERRKRGNGIHKRFFGTYDRIDNRNLLSGVMACPECGGIISQVSGRREGYYGCSAAHRKGTCNWKQLMRRNRVESAVLNHLNKVLAPNKDIIQFVTKRYNEMVREYLKHSPNRKRDIEKELGAIRKELSNLLKVVTKGDASDISTITEALREREDRKAKLKEELSRIEQSEDRQKLYITPFVVQKKLAEAVAFIHEKSERYSGLLANMFDGPLVPYEAPGGVILKGTLDLFRTMTRGASSQRQNPHATDGNGGSRQCMFASPSRGFSNRVCSINRLVGMP